MKNLMDLEDGMSKITDKEFDLLNWRIDQVHNMLVDLAVALGQMEIAEGSVKFHNNEVIPAINEHIASVEINAD